MSAQSSTSCDGAGALPSRPAGGAGHRGGARCRRRAASMSTPRCKSRRGQAATRAGRGSVERKVAGAVAMRVLRDGELGMICESAAVGTVSVSAGHDRSSASGVPGRHVLLRHGWPDGFLRGRLMSGKVRRFSDGSTPASHAVDIYPPLRAGPSAGVCLGLDLSSA